MCLSLPSLFLGISSTPARLHTHFLVVIRPKSSLFQVVMKGRSINTLKYHRNHQMWSEPCSDPSLGVRRKLHRRENVNRKGGEQEGGRGSAVVKEDRAGEELGEKEEEREREQGETGRGGKECVRQREVGERGEGSLQLEERGMSEDREQDKEKGRGKGCIRKD